MRGPDHAWFDQFEVTEERTHLAPAAEVGVAGRDHVAGGDVAQGRRGVFVRAVTEHEQRPGGQLVAVQGQHLFGVLLGHYEMQQGGDQQADRPVRVQPAQIDDPFPQLEPVEKVGIDGEMPLRVRGVGEQDLGVRPRHRIVVDIDHARVTAVFVGDLVHVALRGQARPDVDELRDPVFGPGVPHDPAHEPPVLAGEDPGFGHQVDHPLPEVAIDRVVVVTAEIEVVHPSRAGPVKARRQRLARAAEILGHSPSPPTETTKCGPDPIQDRFSFRFCPRMAPGRCQSW